MKGSEFNITLDNLSGSMMLTIEPTGPIVINDFCCEMIKKTNVFGLLKLNVTTINGEIKFNYDLSKKKPIAEFAKAGFNESYGRRILYNLCNAFRKLNEYYLKPNYCLLEPEYTYIGDGLNVYLPYIPIKDAKTDPDELKNYFSELLSNYFAVEGVSAYDEMFKYVYQCQTLDLSHFISRFLLSEEQSQNNFVAERQERQANKMPLPNVGMAPNGGMPSSQGVPQAPMQNVAPSPSMAKPQKPLAGAPKAPLPNPLGGGIKLHGAGGIKMPGGSEMKMPGGGVQPPMPNNDKKGLFGLGAKKEAPKPMGMPNMPGSAPNVNMPNKPVNNPMPNNMGQNVQAPKFPSGFQSSMDKTIMIDGMNDNPAVQNNNMSIGAAYLSYRGQNIPINDTEFVIGKANNQYKVNFVINNNPHVSRKHATILVQGNSYFIRDEGSTNGTFVNGRSLPKMQPQPLRNGDEISIYDEVFRFCM